jgi:hypothetical protein
MSDSSLPLVISAPEPRTLDLIFTPDALTRFRAKYRIVETTPEGVAALPANVLAEARYIVGQPPIAPETLDKMKALRCVFNVETNLINNMPTRPCSHAASTSSPRAWSLPSRWPSSALPWRSTSPATSSMPISLSVEARSCGAAMATGQRGCSPEPMSASSASAISAAR